MQTINPLVLNRRLFTDIRRTTSENIDALTNIFYFSNNVFETAHQNNNIIYQSDIFFGYVLKPVDFKTFKF